MGSGTKRLDFLLNIGPFTDMENLPNSKQNLPNQVRICAQNELNKPSKRPNNFKISQSGKISSNVVTLAFSFPLFFLWQDFEEKSYFENSTPSKEDRDRNSKSLHLGFIFLKMGQPRPIFNLLSSFQTISISKFTTNKCEKWCRDSNSLHLDYESPPITTRPGLPPFLVSYYQSFLKRVGLQRGNTQVPTFN